MPKARLIIDPPAAGGWNMAVDEALLETAAETGEITLRFYEWTPATLSLGYFQAHDDRSQHAASLACPIVRRSTGGGAIIHDHELTYSLIVPLAGRFGPAASALYDAMHQSLVVTLGRLGLAAQLYRAPQSGSSPLNDGREPFLCFQRRAVGDVVVGDHKIAGSAQRRHHRTVLQHGSILLRQSAAAPELPGIEELNGPAISAAELQSAWLDDIRQTLQLETENRPLAAREADLAHDLHKGKFERADWIYKR